MGRGRWRSAANTQRNLSGTQMVTACPARPAATASATASGVVDNGAASNPAVIFECTKPGRTTRTRTPEPSSSSASPWANASRPAFDAPYTWFDARTRSTVTELRTTSVPWPWSRRRSGRGEAGADRPGGVRGDEGRSRDGVVVGRVIAEHPVGNHYDVEVAGRVGRVGDHGAMGVGPVGVEGHRIDGRRAGIGQPRHLRVQLLGPASTEHHPARPVAHQAFGDGDPDVGAASEHQHALDPAERVPHRW